MRIMSNKQKKRTNAKVMSQALNDFKFLPKKQFFEAKYIWSGPGFQEPNDFTNLILSLI